MGLTLKDELLKRGYVISTQTTKDGKPYREFVSPSGARMTKVGMYYMYPFTSEKAMAISKDKMQAYELAKATGIIIPAGVQTSDVAVARKFLDTYKQVIVKPHNRSGGSGLSVDITTDAQLGKAMERATYHGEAPLIQQQFIGEELRLTVINGEVYSVILRQSPRIVGDGTRTVQQLIEAENVARKDLIFPYLAYPQLTADNIDPAFLTSQTIPEKGETVELNKTTMIRNGASFYGVTNLVHPSYIEIAKRLAAKLDAGLLAVDLMVVDFRAPASDTNYIFLEFNTSPSMIVYSSLRGGDQPPVAEKVVDMIDSYSHSKG